jgi:GAF domain-containing protein
MNGIAPTANPLPEHLGEAAATVIASIQQGEYCALLGPHSSGKSDVLAYVSSTLAEWGQPCLYVDLKEMNVASEADFFTRLAGVTSRVFSQVTQAEFPPLDRGLNPGRAYGNAVAEAVALLQSDLVLMLDHLETIPSDLSRSLLVVLRAVYQQQIAAPSRLIVIVSGALSLAALAVGRNSPFYNIAHRIIVGDLTLEQSSRLITQQLHANGLRASAQAHKHILDATLADPGLIRRVCRNCASLSLRSSENHHAEPRYLKVPTVKRALDEFLAGDAALYRPLQEGVDLVEDDPDLLECILLLLERTQVDRSELPLRPATDADQLYLTGLVRQRGNTYQIRNEIYRRYLVTHFDPGRVGHLLTLAGRWDTALDHLTDSVSNGGARYRSDLLAASVNSMRAAHGVHDAARFLARGLADAFNIHKVCIWLASQPDAKLCPLLIAPDAERTSEANFGTCTEMAFTADRIEARAYREAQPLRSPADQDDVVLRCFPLPAESGPPLGVVTILDPLTITASHERDLDLQGYLTQAARALKDLSTYQDHEDARRELADTLRDITKTLSETLEPLAVMKAILKEMARVLPFDTASIQLPVPGGLRIFAGHGFSNPGIDQLVFPLQPEFPNVRVLQTGKILRYADVQQEYPHFKEPAYQTDKVHGWLGVPLLEGGKTIGVITLDSFWPNRYGPEHEQTATIFASIAAVAIGNALLYDQKRRRAKDLETLAEVAEEFSAGLLGPAPILDQVVRGACRITGCDCAVVYPFLPGQRIYDIDHIAAAGLLQPEQFSPGRKLRSEDTSLAASVVNKGQRIVQDIHTDTDSGLGAAPFIMREQVQAFVGMRLQVGKETLGVLFTNYRQPRQFSEDDLDTMRRLANLAAFATLNSRLYQRIHEDLERRIARMDTLREIDDAISSTLDKESILSLILDRTMQHTQAPYGTIQLVNYTADASPFLELVSRRGATLAAHGERLPLGAGVTGRVAQNNEACRIGNVRSAEWRAIYAPYIPGMVSELAVPMAIEGQVVGVINIEKTEENGFSEDDEEFVKSLAQQAALAIRNALSYEELETTKSRLVAAHAVAWLGLFGADWQHTINQKTFSIENYASGLRTILAGVDIPADVLPQVNHALQGIEHVVDNIRKVEFTSQVPAGTAEIGAVTAVDEKLPQMVERWCHAYPEIIVESSLNCPGICAAIPSQWLEVAMEKLVNNALKAMRDRGGRLTYATRRLGDKLSITIKDTGHGIPEQMRKDFLKNVISRRPEDGTGMGALIARFIALDHGGDLTLVDTDPDRGTELCMLLSVAPSRT